MAGTTPAFASVPQPSRCRGTFGVNITSHAIGMVCVKVDDQNRPVIENGDVEVLVIEYLKRGRRTTRFPVGKGNEGEGWRDTFKREGRQEIGGPASKLQVHLLDENPIYYDVVNDDKVIGASHMKAFFLTRTSGPVREFGIVECQDTPDEEELGAPKWWRLKDLIQFMEAPGMTVQAHLATAIATAGYFAGTNKSVWQTHSRTLERFQEQLTRNRDKRFAVQEYLASFR